MVDSLTHDPDILGLLLKHLGPDNIMIGSDYPFPLGEPENIGATVKNYFKSKKQSEYVLNVKKKIFYKNACKFFEIDVDVLESIYCPEMSDSEIQIDINSVKTDPIGYSKNQTIETLVMLLRELCRAYYNDNPHVDNKTYDGIVGVLRERDSNNPFFIKTIVV